MNKQKTARILGAAALLAAGPVLYAQTSGAASIVDLCHNDFFWGSPSSSLTCAGGKMTAGTSVSSTTGHKQFVVNLDTEPTRCANGGIGEARIFGTTRNGTILSGCGGNDFTADGTSVANTGDGTCDSAYGYYFALSCDNPCGSGCNFTGDECLCGVN